MGVLQWLRHQGSPSRLAQEPERSGTPPGGRALRKTVTTDPADRPKARPVLGRRVSVPLQTLSPEEEEWLIDACNRHRRMRPPK